MDNRLAWISSVTCSNVHSWKNIRNGRSSKSLREGIGSGSRRSQHHHRSSGGNLGAWLWSTSFVRERRSWLLHLLTPPVHERVCIFPALLAYFSRVPLKEKVKLCCVWRRWTKGYDPKLETPFNRKLLTVKREFDVTSCLVRDRWCFKSVLLEDNWGFGHIHLTVRMLWWLK